MHPSTVDGLPPVQDSAGNDMAVRMVGAGALRILNPTSYVGNATKKGLRLMTSIEINATTLRRNSRPRLAVLLEG